jgi:hypothetical protein
MRVHGISKGCEPIFAEVRLRKPDVPNVVQIDPLVGLVFQVAQVAGHPEARAAV